MMTADSYWKWELFARLAGAIAAIGHDARALRLTIDEENYIRATFRNDRWRREAQLANIVEAFASVGAYDRAEALYRELTFPNIRLPSLIQLASSAAATDEHDLLAGRLAAEAVTFFHTHNCNLLDKSMVKLVTVLAHSGENDQAEGIVREIKDYYSRAEAVDILANVFGTAGHVDRAVALIRELLDPYRQAEALVSLANGLAMTGDCDQAARLAADSEMLSRKTADADGTTVVLFDLMAALCAAGDHDRVVQLAVGAEARARGSSNIMALVRLAEILAHAGGHDRTALLADDVQTLVQEITDPYEHEEALVELVTAFAAARAYDRAEAVAREIADTHLREEAFIKLVAGIAAAKAYDRAEALTQEMTNPCLRVTALTELIKALGNGGENDRAARIGRDAESLTRDIVERERRFMALVQLARAVADGGRYENAERLATNAKTFAGEILGPYASVIALAEIAAAVGCMGDYGRALQLCTEAEALARQITDPDRYIAALILIAQSAARTSRTTPLVQASAKKRSVMAMELRLVAHVLQTTSWNAVLPHVARLDLSGLQQFSERLKSPYSR